MGLIALVVDDSAVMRKMVVRSLQQCGLDFSEIIEAANGKEGLEKAQARGKDLHLILSDVNMPEMNGIEFVRALRQVFILKDTPVVMITTEASLAMIKEAKDAGATGYVCKPFTPDKLKEKVTLAIARKGGPS